MIAILIILLFFPYYLFAHDVNYSISKGNAYIVDIYYGDGTKFSYENYEIYGPNEEVAFQVGRTDSWGRIVFMPDKKGRWKIKTFTEDGHGVSIMLDVEEAYSLSVKKLNFFERFAKPVFGIGILLTIFSILNLFVRRKK